VDGWPGVFAAKLHYVDQYTRRMQFDGPYASRFGWTGLWCCVADCGALCVPPSSPAMAALPWCKDCQADPRVQV
jgi:hypothetical protein